MVRAKKATTADMEAHELRVNVPRYMLDFIDSEVKLDHSSRGYIVRRVLNNWIKAEWHKHKLRDRMMREHGNVLEHLPDASETIPGAPDWEREE